ncbi:MAG: ROK family protein [Deltaproteobacteria bacterium]|nr:ROK family protein [Deltaproteobacteria bacterium]
MASKKSKTAATSSILVIDVGGNNVKVALGHHTEPVRVPSGKDMTAAQMVAGVKAATKGWAFDRVSLGFPGPVKDGKPAREPVNLSTGWVALDYEKAFGVPVRIVNDAALQALGNYDATSRGRMLFMGLGTGLGTTLVGDTFVQPLELAHLPYRKDKSYEDFVGERGLERLGKKKWTEHVFAVVALLRDAMQVDEVVLGGGQTKRLEELPPGVRRGRDDAAIVGGVELWSR